MKHFVRHAVDGLLYSNLFIALCAAAFTRSGQYLIDPAAPVDVNLTLFVFFSTYALYTAIRLQSMRNLVNPLQHPRLSWLFRFRVLGIVLFFLTAVAAGLFFFKLEPGSRLWIIPAGLISVFYSLPFMPFAKKIRLRNKGVSKIFLIAVVWAVTGALLPATQMSGSPLEWQTLTALFASRFLFIFAITLPFDIRDLSVDSSYGLITLPSLLGAKRSNVLAQASLLLSFLLLIPLETVTVQTIWRALTPAYILTALIIWQASRDRHEYWYLGLLDGTMLLQWLLLYYGQSH